MNILKATCSEGIVKVGDTIVPNCDIMSQGSGESSGYVLISQEEFFYLTNTISDIKDLLTQVSGALNTLATATSFGTTMVAQGPLTPAPLPLVPDPALQASLQSFKDALDELNGRLK